MGIIRDALAKLHQFGFEAVVLRRHDEPVAVGSSGGHEYRIDETLVAPEPGMVAVVDDLLTSGAHFRAAKRVLTRRFAGIKVVGLFLARQVREEAG